MIVIIFSTIVIICQVIEHNHMQTLPLGFNFWFQHLPNLWFLLVDASRKEGSTLNLHEDHIFLEIGFVEGAS